MDRGSAAKIGGMDRQTLRDWVHRFNASGPDGLIDSWTEGPKPRLSQEQMAAFAQIVEAGPDREKDGVVRWRRIDLKHVIAERFGVDFHPRYVGKLLKKLGFSHISARPRHPAQDERIVEGFKKLPACAEGPSRRTAGSHAGRDLVPSLCSRGLCQTGKPHIWNRSACRWSNVCHQIIYLAIELSSSSWVIAYRVPRNDKAKLPRLSFQG
jgi:putative transposase